MKTLTSLISKRLESLNSKFYQMLKAQIIEELEEYEKLNLNTLFVVVGVVIINTTDRGLQFSRNWFKNKVPHHPASPM